eukprot:2116634-Amphidinium_carterae.1
MMRVTAMTPRTIGPNRSYALPVNQGGLKVSDGRYPGRREKPMQLDTRGHLLGVLRHLHFSALLVPVRASEDNVREVLGLLLTSHTERPHMERTVCTHFMPDPSKGSVESTAEAVLSAVGTFLQVP